jgi:pyruvate/2-oxoglutarate dehydrogenase complex dihydrolipoamide dehydrogenase (E3) component
MASVPPNKGYIEWATEWFVGEVQRQKVNVMLNRSADLKNIVEMNPDVVLLATGAEPMTPAIPGIEDGIQSWDILKGTVETPKNQKVIVLGGGVVGCETALHLVQNGCKVDVIEMMPDFAAGLEGANKLDLIDDFKEKDIKLHLNAKVNKIENCKVYYNGTEVMDYDSVVIALGQKSVGADLKKEIESNGIEVQLIGDAVKPRKFLNATQEGFFAAINL